MHWRNKRKHPLQFLCQTRERKFTPSDRQVCVHNNWWTEIIWNKDKECYYTNGLLKRLHDYDETNSKESQNSEAEEPTVDQQIRQTPINPTLKNSPLVATMNSPADIMMTTTTEETTATTTTTSAFRSTPTQSQRIASTMQKAFQHRKKPGNPDRGGSGPPRGGGGPPGGGQPPAAQQPVLPTPDVKAMGSLPQSLTEISLRQTTLLKKSRVISVSMPTFQDTTLHIRRWPSPSP